VDFPEEAITTTKKGKKEARVLKEKGEYVWYAYVDLEKGKEEKKTKLVLIQPGREMREFFVFPTSDGKKYLLAPTETKGARAVFDREKGKMVFVDDGGITEER